VVHCKALKAFFSHLVAKLIELQTAAEEAMEVEQQSPGTSCSDAIGEERGAISSSQRKPILLDVLREV
jgi:hypothetical protein